MEARQDHDTDEFAKLRKDFPGWSLWRGKKRNGEPASYNATRTDKAAGIYPTVGGDTVEALRAELEDQKRRADRGEPRPEVAPIPVPHQYGGPDFNPAYM